MDEEEEGAASVRVHVLDPFGQQIGLGLGTLISSGQGRPVCQHKKNTEFQSFFSFGGDKKKEIVRF